MKKKTLMPIDEQPYSIPDNWRWIHLGDVTSNQYGYTAKAITDTRFPKMLRITDIHEFGVDWGSVPNCYVDEDDIEKYKLQENDIVIARTGATTGKSHIIKNPPLSVFASYLIRVRTTTSVSPKYVVLFLQIDLYWRQITELSSGIAQPGVNSSKLQTLVFPLAPYAEQQRIVDCIESLFAKLDEAKKKAQTVVDGFEDRKAFIMHKAFTGELTAEWRKKHGITISSWETCQFGSLVSEVKLGLVRGKTEQAETKCFG